MEKIESSTINKRIKTACIGVPILILLFSTKISVFSLMIVLVYLSYKEYYVIQSNILSIIFEDYYTKTLRLTLLSSPLFSLIFMICPVLFFFMPNAELIGFVLPTFMVIAFRIHNFLLVYGVLIPHEYEITTGTEAKEKEKEKVEKAYSNTFSSFAQTDLKSAMKDEEENLKKSATLSNSKTFHKTSSFISANDSKKAATNNTPGKNSLNIIKLRMYSCCLFIILLDLAFFVFYVYSLSFIIYFHNLSQGGLLYLIIWLFLCWQCDNGALCFGSYFGKTPLGRPITPTKTREGVYGAFVFGVASGFVIRTILHELTSYKFLSLFNFFCYIFSLIFLAIFGDFFESFLKRSADIKDSGAIFPGHGGLLDRIDSITLATPITYYFLLNQ